MENANRAQIRTITYLMFFGMEAFDLLALQVNSPTQIYSQLREIAFEAWDRVRPEGAHDGFWNRILQKSNESYVDFIVQLQKFLNRTVQGVAVHTQMLKHLAFENANEECRQAI